MRSWSESNVNLLFWRVSKQLKINMASYFFLWPSAQGEKIQQRNFEFRYARAYEIFSSSCIQLRVSQRNCKQSHVEYFLETLAFFFFLVYKILSEFFWIRRKDLRIMNVEYFSLFWVYFSLALGDIIIIRFRLTKGRQRIWESVERRAAKRSRICWRYRETSRGVAV